MDGLGVFVAPNCTKVKRRVIGGVTEATHRFGKKVVAEGLAR
jgi:hypothetical protein